MSAHRRDETSVFRHVTPGCGVCGAALLRADTGRQRLYRGPACRQRAYRLRDEARQRRDAESLAADRAEDSRLLATVLCQAGGR